MRPLYSTLFTLRSLRLTTKHTFNKFKSSNKWIRKTKFIASFAKWSVLNIVAQLSFCAIFFQPICSKKARFRQFSISTKDWIDFRKWWAQYYFLWNWIACSISSAAFGKKTAIQAFSLYANFDRTWLQNRRSCDFLKAANVNSQLSKQLLLSYRYRGGNMWGAIASNDLLPAD